jgi:hypothetical protein
LLEAMEIAVVISPDHNDPESWRDWSDKDKHDEHTKRFKRKLATDKTEKTDPLAILIVMNMLLTGFDAPVEQVMYLDRKVVAHDLLQAIARVNRTCGRKKCGYVVDYIGVARHLNEALKDYDGEDTEGTLIDISVELPKLLDRRDRAVAVFTDRGITDLLGQVEDCVALLEDLKVRAEFINKLRMFYETLNILEHRPEVPPDVFRDAKLLGFINKVAANLYRDPALNLLGVAEKVKALIDEHIAARGVDPKIPPTAITDAECDSASGLCERREHLLPRTQLPAEGGRGPGRTPTLRRPMVPPAPSGPARRFPALPPMVCGHRQPLAAQASCSLAAQGGRGADAGVRGRSRIPLGLVREEWRPAFQLATSAVARAVGGLCHCP